ncbi:MAG: hypothetical protein OEZ22_12945 [Spirochaetia bacterium]|nr:hypothetical protein [Spirochaetia bacterium]
MKCRKQPLWVKIEIKNIWEVHIDLSVWENIKIAAKIHNKSYSWIVRYCVFQLANKKNLRWTKKMQNINKDLKLISVNEKHRHQLCLYGDDEIFLRTAALILGISISQLIRISIAMFLKRFLTKKVSKENLFWYGIKIFARINKFRSLKENYIAMDFQSYKIFLPSDYWGFT